MQTYSVQLGRVDCTITNEMPCYLLNLSAQTYSVMRDSYHQDLNIPVFNVPRDGKLAEPEEVDMDGPNPVGL